MPDRPETIIRLVEQIGRFDSTLTIFGQTLAQLRDEMRHSNEEASERRREMYKLVDGISHRLHMAEDEIKALKRSAEKIEPFADKLNRWEQRGIGAVAVLVTIGGFIGAAVTAFWSKLMAALFH